MPSTTERQPSSWLAPIYALVVMAAVIAVFFAYLTYWFGCHGDVPSASGCPDRDPTATMVAQLAAAVLALAAVGATALCDLTGRRRIARRLMLAALGLFAAWALLMDAATHGWDNLHLLP